MEKCWLCRRTEEDIGNDDSIRWGDFLEFEQIKVYEDQILAVCFGCTALIYKLGKANILTHIEDKPHLKIKIIQS